MNAVIGYTDSMLTSNIYLKFDTDFTMERKNLYNAQILDTLNDRSIYIPYKQFPSPDSTKTRLNTITTYLLPHVVSWCMPGNCFM